MLPSRCGDASREDPSVHVSMPDYLNMNTLL